MRHCGSCVPGHLPTDLTDREREVLELVNAGHTHRAIAARLALAPKTIRNTVASINVKQRAANSTVPD